MDHYVGVHARCKARYDERGHLLATLFTENQLFRKLLRDVAHQTEFNMIMPGSLYTAIQAALVPRPYVISDNDEED